MEDISNKEHCWWCSDLQEKKEVGRVSAWNQLDSGGLRCLYLLYYRLAIDCFIFTLFLLQSYEWKEIWIKTPDSQDFYMHPCWDQQHDRTIQGLEWLLDEAWFNRSTSQIRRYDWNGMWQRSVGSWPQWAGMSCLLSFPAYPGKQWRKQQRTDREEMKANSSSQSTWWS